MPTSIAAFLTNATPHQKLLVEQVRDEQLKLGMKPRDDSLLTVQYACGETDVEYKDPADVAGDLVAVDQIYQSTLYPEVVTETLRLVARWLRRKYHLPWGDTWAIVREHGPTMVKLYCLDVCPTRPSRESARGCP